MWSIDKVMDMDGMNKALLKSRYTEIFKHQKVQYFLPSPPHMAIKVIQQNICSGLRESASEYNSPA